MVDSFKKEGMRPDIVTGYADGAGSPVSLLSSSNTREQTGSAGTI